ncbi:hypothetical protein L6452_22050 [Arctium lappa]|uniref:Uncharacterized protein n=1 Tax=Arctium lappa TaxID=4217 RepID=A0ACB9B0E6_ARCLA|nr:hypothetical protein L6452_22050 [Arctium lappa]
MTLPIVADLALKTAAASIPKNMNLDKVSKVESSYASKVPIERFLDSFAASNSSGSKKNSSPREKEIKNSLAQFSNKRFNAISDGSKALKSNFSCKRILCSSSATKSSPLSQNEGSLFKKNESKSPVEGSSKVRHDCKNDLRALMNRSLVASPKLGSPCSNNKEKRSSCDKESERSGHNCILCNKEFSYSAQDDYGSHEDAEYKYRIEFRPQLLPCVDVLPCGHAFHSECLRYVIPEEQSTDPQCVLCLSMA